MRHGVPDEGGRALIWVRHGESARFETAQDREADRLCLENDQGAGLEPLRRHREHVQALHYAEDPLGGFSACVPGIDVFGGGDSPAEATLALAVILGKALATGQR